MEPYFLAKLIGAYFLIVGVLVATRKRSIMPAIAELAKNRSLLLVIAVVELAAGLAIVIYYPLISWDWIGLISLVGWMMIVEGIMYLAAPTKFIQKFIKRFNRSSWYTIGGGITVILGLYLLAAGFQLL
jgi:hypothetical protein